MARKLRALYLTALVTDGQISNHTLHLISNPSRKKNLNYLVKSQIPIFFLKSQIRQRQISNQNVNSFTEM